MTNPVHIVAYARNEQGGDAATLVFRTLRTGFPNAPVVVWGNALPTTVERRVVAECRRVGASYQPMPSIAHDAWLENLVSAATAPFWVCDTDIVFWKSIEEVCQFGPETLFAGRYEPAFSEEWTGCVKPARLHTSLLYINPVALRMAIRAYMCRIPMPWRYSASFPLVRQTFVPQPDGTMLCYDTCAGLHAALGGTPFTEEQNSAYDHLHCATFADLISPHLSVPNLQGSHAAIYNDLTLAKGIRAKQDEYYASRKPHKELYV